MPGSPIKRTFKKFLARLRRIEWVVYCKKPFAGPEQVLGVYLSRYTHRVAISNRRLVAADDGGVIVPLEGLSHRRSWPLENHDAYGARVHPPVPDARPAEGLPSHPPLRAAGERHRAANIARARELLAVPVRSEPPASPETTAADQPRCCRVHAPVAADAWSSSRPSGAAASPSTAPRRCRQRSGSTPHDDLIADPKPHRYMPFRPTPARQRHRLRWPARLARRRTANPVAQPVEPCSASFTPPPASMFCRQATAATTSAKPSRTARRGQIPMPPAPPVRPTHRDFVPWRFSECSAVASALVYRVPDIAINKFSCAGFYNSDILSD